MENFIAYEKNDRDNFTFIKAENESACYDSIVASLDMSKNYVFYSVLYLLATHKAINDFLRQGYEFNYADDILNNERSFQEILIEMDKYPEIKPDMEIDARRSA